ncbi:MAG: formate dehydrogenase accessory sulfurtransferase FdhD [Caldisericaceae bacterium]
MKEIEIIRFENGIFQKRKDSVVRERILNIFVGGEFLNSIIYSSGFSKELLFGYLYLEGLINSVHDVTEYRETESEYSVNYFVEVRKSEIASISKERITVNRNTLFSLMEELLSKGEIFSKTGGTHIAGLAEDNKLSVYFEDISRRSAIQKCVGFSILNKLRPDFLFLSGRVGFNTVLYAKRAGINFIVSQSSASDLAIRTATSEGITLIGFLRGKRFNIYSHAEYVE